MSLMAGHSPVSMGRTPDISPSGMRLEVYRLLTIDSFIELDIGIEFDEPQIGLDYGLKTGGPWDNSP